MHGLQCRAWCVLLSLNKTLNRQQHVTTVMQRLTACLASGAAILPHCAGCTQHTGLQVLSSHQPAPHLQLPTSQLLTFHCLLPICACCRAISLRVCSLPTPTGSPPARRSSPAAAGAAAAVATAGAATPRPAAAAAAAAAARRLSSRARRCARRPRGWGGARGGSVCPRLHLFPEP